VTGATGFVGSYLVPALIRDRHEAVCLVRPTSDLSGLQGLEVKLVHGDVTDKEALLAALDGVEAVVHLAGVNVPDLETCRRINVEGVRLLIEACHEQGVRRVVANSTVSATREHLGAYGLTKKQGEELWRDSGLDVTILRFSLVYGPGAKGIFAKLLGYVKKLPAVPIIGPGTFEVQPIYVGDVVDAILRCLGNGETIGKTYVLAGREPTTMNQFVDLMLAESGKRKPKLHIPVPLAMLMARTMALVLPNPPVTVDNILGMNQPTDYDIATARRDFGWEPRPLREGLREALSPIAYRLSHIGDNAQSAISDTPYAIRHTRIAIIGLGRMGIAHAALLNTIPGAKLVGFCDLNRRLGQQARGMGFRDVPFYTDVTRLLEETQPDGVFLCTPPHVHLPLARQCVTRGVGVFVEKPLAHSLAAAQEMVALLEGRRLVHAVGYHYAYVPIFQWARELLAEGIVGRPTGVRASMFLSQVLGPKRASWWYEPNKAGGGVVISIASHLLALLPEYFGPVAWVEAQTRRVHSEQVEDEATIRLGFASGLEATVETSWSVPGYERSAMEIAVEGENGTLAVTDEEMRLALQQARSGFPVGERRIPVSDVPDPAAFELSGPGFWAEDADFVACLEHGRLPRVSWHEALAVQAVVDAVYRSADRGEKVVLNG
jgi:NADH dehydrogenase